MIYKPYDNDTPIGGDITVEQQMARRMPHCVMVGADPSKQYGQLFKNVGRFHDVAVGSKSGKYLANVLTFSDKANKYGYEWVTTLHLSLTSFMQLHMDNRSLVDFLLLDAEGSEYQ